MDWLKTAILNPWPWYVAGPLITFTMIFIGFFGQSFGISSTLRTICAAAGGKKFSELFNFDWKRDLWNLVFIAGAIFGGYLASEFLSNTSGVNISAETLNRLKAWNVSISKELVPKDIFCWKSLLTLKGFLMLVVGGFLVGFGTRYAGGCTSGHAITGLSNLQWPSVIAVIGFFIGGLVMSHFILPHILKL